MAHKSSLHIGFFTDEKANSFHPLTLTRPLDDLRIGIFTIREKWMRHMQLNRYCRLLPNYLDGVFNRGEISEEQECVWINARFLPSAKLLEAIHNLQAGEQLTFNGDTAAAKTHPELSARMFKANKFTPAAFKSTELTEAIHLEHLWDLLSLNAFEMDKDLPLTNLKPISESGLAKNVSVQQPENIFVHETAIIEPGCIFLGSEGPVIIRQGARIEAGSILRGPVVIGKNATVKMKGRIHGGSTIGPVCKVGGEVSNCIFHSYSNKAHDGFTGNSIFGQWVNLGADTITSNLNNSYSPVRMADWNSGKEIETGAQFLGTVMGDHSKTAINTILNTGTICGVSSNIFMSGFPPRYIPSFAWVNSADYGTYKFDKAIEGMQAMMKRRDVDLADVYTDMMSHIFKHR